MYFNNVILAGNWWNDLVDKFILDFVEKDRWKFITGGLLVTFEVTLFSLLIGTIIGILIAVIRTSHDQIGKKNLKGISGFLLRLLNLICRLYLTIIRGTPALVQLLFMYFVFLVATNNKVLVASISFGINSGAYVAEIMRSGIMSVDKGQMEAGRALGLGYGVPMTSIIMPQAIKNTLPALVNEMITLLKETSICGYIGLNELTRGGDIIRGTTFDALLPLFGVAIIYLITVIVLSSIFSAIERRLRKSEH